MPNPWCLTRQVVYLVVYPSRVIVGRMGSFGKAICINMMVEVAVELCRAWNLMQLR